MEGPSTPRRVALAAFVTTALVSAGLARADDPGTWQPRATLELGVDSFAQIFRITEDLSGGLLQAESSYRDTTDVFTELRGRAEFALERDGQRWRSRIRTRLSTGTELDREGLGLELDFDSGEGRSFDLAFDVEARQFRDEGDFTLVSDAQEARLRTRWRQALDARWEAGVSLRAEAERFDDRGVYELDEDRLDLSGLLSWSEGWTRFADLEVGGGRKAVRDSTEISYNHGYLHAQLGTAFSDRWHMDLRHLLERRVYDDEYVRRPFWDVVIEPALRFRWNERWTATLQAPLEWLVPDENTNVYFDLFTGRVALDLSWSRQLLEIGGQLRWSWLDSSEEVEDRYEQPSVEVHVDWFGSERFWLSFSEEFGERRYRDAADPTLDLYSDYTFFRTTLLGGVKLHTDLSLELFLSDEPESHRRQSDDSRLTLVSASLRASF